MKSYKYKVSQMYPCNACCCAACATLHSFCDRYRAKVARAEGANQVESARVKL